MVTLEDARRHCRIDQSVADFDLELQIALEASVDHLRSIDVNMDADPLPPALAQAVLLLVAHFFSNKEAVVYDRPMQVTPLGVARLIAPYRGVSL